MRPEGAIWALYGFGNRATRSAFSFEKVAQASSLCSTGWKPVLSKGEGPVPPTASAVTSAAIRLSPFHFQLSPGFLTDVTEGSGMAAAQVEPAAQPVKKRSERSASAITGAQ